MRIVHAHMAASSHADPGKPPRQRSYLKLIGPSAAPSEQAREICPCDRRRQDQHNLYHSRPIDDTCSALENASDMCVRILHVSKSWARRGEESPRTATLLRPLQSFYAART